MNSKEKYVDNFIKPCLSILYQQEATLFKDNLSERCVVFRFAHHLQSRLKENDEYADYFVDCDYNSSVVFNSESGERQRKPGKLIGATKRFIDIIVHKRTKNQNKICFEIKKWNNRGREAMEKDRNNLKVLTNEYGYEYGFHLIFGKTKEETILEVFKEGVSEGIFPLFSQV